MSAARRSPPAIETCQPRQDFRLLIGGSHDIFFYYLQDFVHHRFPCPCKRVQRTMP